MAGRAPKGSQITVYDGDKPLASGAVDDAGEWVLLLEAPMTAGTREFNVAARLADGSTIESEEPVLVILPESLIAPAAGPIPAAADAMQPSVVVRLPSRSGQASRLLQRPRAAEARRGSDSLGLDTIDYDEQGSVVISGSAPAGAVVRVYLDDSPIAVVVADDRNRWSLLPDKPIAPGNYALRLDHLGPDGKVLVRIEVPFTRAEPALVQLASLQGYSVVVQPGDYLWKIARMTYGRGIMYTLIFQANKSHIRDPDLIYPGQIFDLPDPSP